MKTAGLAMVRNEADIIESFVRYNLQYLDELIIVLHSCHDETPQIVEQLQREGLPVSVLHNHELAFRKAHWMNKTAREVLTAKRADWLIMLDADEFIKVPSRDYLDRALASTPEDAAPVLRWQSYVPTPEDAVDEPHPLRRIQHRCAVEPTAICKVAIRPTFHLDHTLTIAEGNHGVVRRLGNVETPIRHVTFQDLVLAHLPVRSAGQAITKIMVGTWSRWLQQGAVDQNMNISSHWIHFYQQVMRDGGLSAEQLREVALDYQRVAARKGTPIDRTLVRDPLPADFSLRYTPQSASSPWLAIGSWVEQLIQRSGQLPEGKEANREFVPLPVANTVATSSPPRRERTRRA
jgi:hypothetical protein